MASCSFSGSEWLNSSHFSCLIGKVSVNYKPVNHISLRKGALKQVQRHHEVESDKVPVCTQLRWLHYQCDMLIEFVTMT